MFIASIVEGQGEVDSLPALLHKIAASIPNATHLRVNNPIRVKVGTFLNDEDSFRRIVELAASKAIQEGGMVLILLDCEDDCPAQLGPKILDRAKKVRGDVSIAVVLACREYESWLLTAAVSLSGVCGLPQELRSPENVLAIRNAKGWLAERMPTSYDPISHQRLLTRAMDLTAARSNQSFDRLYRIVQDAVTTELGN